MAENGTIEQSMKGSGVLETASNVEVTVPGNITVTKYLVSNGDFVEAGDPIAVVEKKSVMAAIADLQEVIDEVDDAIEDAKEESITSYIKATVDGTVVAVYGKKGEDVLDVMYEKGALMLLSLDNLLAVRVDNPGSVNVGDKLTIKDKDGNSATGKIAQVEKDTIVVTVSLSNFSFEEEVTVYGVEEKSLGTGKLYIYSQQKVTGFSGTISSVKVSKGDKISAGNTLLTLSDTDYTAAYQNLLNKRIVLEEQYNQLVEVGNSGYVYAKEAGSISNIYDSLVVSAAAENTKTASGKIDDNLAATGNHVIRTSHTSSGMILTSQRNQTGFILTTADTSTEGTTKEEETTPAETVSKSVNLVWLNSDGNAMTEGMPQQVVIQLCNGETILDERILDVKTEWKYTWTQLEKYDSDGSEIPYTIKIKDAVEGYTITTQIIDSVTVLIFTKEAEKTPSSDNPNGEQLGEMPDDDQQGTLPDGSQEDGSQMPDGNG